MSSQKWKNENSTAHLQNSNVNKAFRGFANVTGPNTQTSEKKFNQIFIPNASSGDMRILDQKSPRSAQLTKILPAQLQPKEPLDLSKLHD